MYSALKCEVSINFTDYIVACNDRAQARRFFSFIFFLWGILPTDNKVPKYVFASITKVNPFVHRTFYIMYSEMDAATSITLMKRISQKSDYKQSYRRHYQSSRTVTIHKTQFFLNKVYGYIYVYIKYRISTKRR